MSKEYPCYYETRGHVVEYDPASGVVVVTDESNVLVGAYRFEYGLLTECVGRGVLPDALADEIEERYGSER